MYVNNPVKIASTLFCVCTVRQIFHLSNYQYAGQDKILSYYDLFIKIQEQLGSLFLDPFSSLIISIHISIFEALLKKFPSNFYMFQTPQLLQGFSHSLHYIDMTIIHYMHSSFPYIARSKQTSLLPP